MTILTCTTALDLMRRIHYRQIVRYRHSIHIDALVKLEFVWWVRQAQPVSHGLLPRRVDGYRPPVEVAILSITGLSALRTLNDAERSTGWDLISGTPVSEFFVKRKV